jgi:hypothetical protein
VIRQVATHEIVMFDGFGREGQNESP